MSNQEIEHNHNDKGMQPDTCPACAAIKKQGEDMREYTRKLTLEIKAVCSAYKGLSWDDKKGAKVTFSKRELNEVLSAICHHKFQPCYSKDEVGPLMAYFQEKFHLRLECTLSYENIMDGIWWNVVIYDLDSMDGLLGMQILFGSTPEQEIFSRALYMAYCIKMSRIAAAKEAGESATEPESTPEAHPALLEYFYLVRINEDRSKLREGRFDDVESAEAARITHMRKRLSNTYWYEIMQCPEHVIDKLITPQPA